MTIVMHVPFCCPERPWFKGFLAVIHDDKRPIEFFPVRNFKRGINGETGSPLNAGSPKGNGERGAVPPFLSPVGVETGFPRSHRGSRAAEHGLKEALEMAIETQRELAGMLSLLVEQLAPSDAEESSIKAALTGHYGRKLDIGEQAIMARRPLFQRLTDLSAEWGRLRGERRNVKTSLKAVEREVDRLRREIRNKSQQRRSA